MINIPNSKEKREKVLENLRKNSKDSIPKYIKQEVESLSDEQLIDPKNLKSFYTKITTAMKKTRDSDKGNPEKYKEMLFGVDPNLCPNSMSSLARILDLSNAGLSKIFKNLKEANPNQDINNLRWFLECISLILMINPYFLLGLSDESNYGANYIAQKNEKINPIAFLDDRTNVAYELSHNLADSQDERRKKAYEYIIRCSKFGQKKQDIFYDALKKVATQKELKDDINWNASPKDRHIKDNNLDKFYSSNPELVKLLTLFSRSDEYIDIMIFLFEKCGFLDDKRRTVQNDK